MSHSPRSPRSGPPVPGGGKPPGSGRAGDAASPSPAGAAAADERRDERERMVSRQLETRDIKSSRVLAAMRQVPRHRFVPPSRAAAAYEDHPLPIGSGQTISQPYIVALMSQAARVKPGAKVLEIGTGCGYQAAILDAMGARVYSIEVVDVLARQTEKRLAELGYGRVSVRLGDGFWGWPEQAPFDAVVVTAAPPEIPEPLKEQLAVGGRLVVPVGRWSQELTVVERTAAGFDDFELLPVLFVPMTGEAQGNN